MAVISKYIALHGTLTLLLFIPRECGYNVPLEMQFMLESLSSGQIALYIGKKRALLTQEIFSKHTLGHIHVPLIPAFDAYEFSQQLESSLN